MNKGRAARFTVAFNGDDQLIPVIAGFPGVDSLFGKLSRDIVGGGRPTYALANIGMKGLRNSIRVAHQQGLKFYYLLNSACMANQEFSRSTNKRINNLLDVIAEAEVDGVVVSMPYLLALVKKRYPALRVSISTFAGIDSAQKAQSWQDRGADRLILSPDVNRNRSVLERIRGAISCELELFVNVMCLHRCPFAQLHAACNGHASCSTDSLKGFGVDYYSYQCADRRLRSPSELIRGRFIRPEDIHCYEDLGIDVFKISDRLKGTPWLIRAARAYSSRLYDGNLADLISYPVVGAPQDRPLCDPTRHIARSRHANLAMLKVMRGITTCMLPMYIDNRKLDGFLEHYFRHDCENSSCGVDCRYCESVAARAVTFDPEKRAACLDHIARINEMLEERWAFTRDSPLVQLTMSLVRILSSRKNDFGVPPH